MNSNGYAIQKGVAHRLHQIGGLPAGNCQILEIEAPLYHRRNVNNDGTTTRLVFFNEPKTKGVTNVDQASTIPANMGFAVESIGIEFYPGIDRNGSRATVFAGGGAIRQTCLSSGNAGAVITDTLVADQWKWWEKYRELMSGGILSFTVANRVMFEIADLFNFPTGRGGHGICQSDTGFTAAAGNSVSHVFSLVNNGAPLRENRLKFNEPFVIPAGQTYEVALDWLTGVNFQDATIGPLVGATAGNPAGFIQLQLDGRMIRPGSH